MVLFAKIIPEKIEASLFAFLMGLTNLSYLFVSGNLAVVINLEFVGVTYDDTSRVWELYAIQAVMSLIPLCFIWLIPTRDEVAKVQRCYEWIELYDEKENVDEAARFEDWTKLDPSTAKRCGIKKPAGEELATTH
jgi:hypothetical protein